MGRAKRGGPGGRSYPWLNLCKSNSELRKLLPAYFSKIAHNHTIVCTRSSGMNTTVISNAVCSSSETQQDALREISNNLAAGKVRKSGATSQSSLYHIDEDATTKLHQLINFSLISKSLNLSPIQWKSVPQLYGIKHKHNSAICGVIIKKKKKGRKSSKALSSERTPLHKCKEKKKSEETARLSQLAEAHTDFREQSDTIQNVESKTESHKLPTSTDGNLSEDSTVTTAVGKRQRRLTAKAAEAIAEATLRRHRKTLTSSCSKGKIMSDDEHVVSENEKKTADASKTANEVEPVSVADHVSQLDSVVKSPFSHTTPLVDKEKVEPQVKSSLLDIAADEINTEILSTVTPVVEERNFISKTTGHKTPLLPDTPNSAKNNESLNPNKDESFIETTVVDVTARDQPDYLVTNTCEIKSLSDDPIESKNNDESVNSLQDLVIRESVQVFDTSTSEQQGVIGTVENLSYNIEPSPRSFVQLKSEVSDGVSDELDRKTTIAEEILIQTDIQAVTEGNESEALDKENDSVETEEARNIDQPSELEYNDQEQPEVNNETDRNVESNSVDDSGSTPPMKFDVHNPPVIKTVKPRAHKRSPSPGDAPIIRSKRRLKVNHRFLDDFDGYLGFIKGGHRSRASSEVSNGSEGSSNRTTEHSTRHSHRTSKSRLLSWYNKKHSNEKIKKTSVLENPTKSSKGDKSNDSHNTNSKQEEKCGNRPVTGLRPRVKQVSRPSLNREDSRYSSTFSAMVHAARLAAVGAKVPGGVSPVHAALAASAAHSNRMKERRSDAKHNDLNVNGQGVIPHSTFHPSKPVSTAQNSTHLPKRCGQCPACLGLIQPCGHCSDCRLVDNNDPRRRPCRELICFRRRAAVAAADQNLKTGPRVKFPSNYPSPGSSSSLPICGYKGALSNNMVSHASNRSALHRSDNEPDESVSFLRTVPGLAQKLELDAWLPPVNSQKMHTSGVNPSYHRKQKHAGKNLNVGPELQVTPVRGGDLGMHFISSIEENDDNEDLDRVRPVEGEVIDSELATRGGYAVVTTLAAAPPKEICYACGSGGGQLLFCVSCAEPFHFYCVERQFRPRKKEHFICRNCTTCKVCRRPASDLRCIRCSVGYHPDCLLDFPPAKTSQRGCWTCPECSVCLHCGVRACKPAETSDVGTSSIVRGNYTPWSLETNKCAACSQAESRGDLCPECDRAYLPSTKQMVQCDSCQLWIHRTCTKLTVDEYELIARMPAGQLSKFVVICSVCQKEQKSQQKSNSSRSNNPSKQSDFQDQSGTDMTENTDEDNEGMNNRNTNSPNSVAHQLRMLAQDTLLERMAGLVQNCCRPSEHDQNAASSINSPSSVSVHSPTHMTASSGGKSPGLGSSVNNKNEHPTRQCLPQYDGVCDSDSGDELTAAVEAAASLWNPLVEPSKITPTSENPGLLPSISINNQSCEIVCDTLSTSGISSDPVSVSSNLTSQPFQTNTLSLTSPMDSIRNSGNAVSSEISVLPIQPSPLTVNTGYKTEFSPLQPNVHSETALRECYPNSSRRRYSSSSSSSSRQIIVPAPPISALWLVDNESEDIWTSPRSLVYRILTRILRRLSAHAVSSEAAGILRKLLCWFTSVTQAFFPWLNVTEMASDVRDILRQSNGKFSDVVKHFQELSLIELHELVCPVIARLSENCSRVRNSMSDQTVYSVRNISTCYLHIREHLKEYHLNYQLNESTELDPLEVTKQFVAVCKRSRCRRPHEVEMFEQMKQSARDDRWIEYWSSIEEEMVVKKFQNHLIKLYRKRLHKLPALPSPDQSSQHNKCRNATSNVYNPSGNGSDPLESNKQESIQQNSETLMENHVESSDQEIANKLSENGESNDLNMHNSDIPLTPLLLLENDENEPPIDSSVVDSGRFYFALEEFWNEDEIRKPLILPKKIPSQRFVDLDEEEEVNQKIADDALRKHLADDCEDEDSRRCLLCGYHGDDNIEGRLLYTGSDTWVHVNCALWCNDVYEEDSGELIGLSDAIRRGRSSKCADCGKYGATLYCSNMKTEVCPLSLLASSSDYDSDYVGAVHFSCALRRCPPSPRCVFTADRSWFCSPVCHHTTMNQRLCEALYSLRKSSKTNRDKKFSRRESWDQSSDEELSPDTINPADFADHPAFTSIEETIADDLEPISLGDLLVCRRVFVPSDCFAASVYPRSINTDIIQDVFLMDDDEHSDLMRAAKEAVSALAVSPNSFAFLQNNGLSANSLVITIGSLRVDRLGEVREASDSLAMAKWIPDSYEERNAITRSNYLCPIHYRARRIYWSWSKLDSRVPYTLHVRQNQALHTSSGYIEANPTSRLSPIVITNSSKSISLSKMPVVNATNLTRSHNTPRLVNVDSRIRLLAPASTNKSSPYFYASSTLTHNNLVGSSNNYGVKSNNMTLSTVQESSKTLTAVLTGAPPIISSSTILLSEYEPPVLLSRPVVHNNTVTCYSTIPVSGFQIVTSSINNPVSQRQMIQSSTLTPHNPSLKIINTVSLSTPSYLQQSQQHQLSSQQPLVPLHMAPQASVKIGGSMVALDIVNSMPMELSYRIGINPTTAAPSSTQLRVNSVNMVPIKQQLQPQQNHLLQLQQLQQNKLQVNACTGRTLLLPNLYQPNIIPVNNLTMPNTIIPVQQNGLSCPIGTMNPFPVNMNTNKSVTLSHGGPNGTTVIRIQNVHSSQKGGGLLTSPTKDVQLATHLDGLFHNVSMATSPNKRGATSTTNSLSQTGRRLLPQLDGTGDDDDGPNYGSDPIRRCSYKTRSSSSLSSSNSLSHRTAASGRSKSHFPSNRLAKNELLCKANKKTRTTNKSVSPKPEGKRRWIEDRIRQQELAHLVLKAKQASHARLYQNEVEKHVRSFRLTFSIDGVVRSTSSPIAAWRSVIMRVSSLREKHGLKPLICTAIDGWSQFGLNHRYLIFLIEQMRGAFHCYRYRFQYHWQKIDRLRQKFTPPVPCSEGCARAVPWEKPRLPRNHARDSLAFLRCKANPPPRPLVSSSEGNVLPYQDPCLVNTNEPTKLLSPNEQATCREAARQAAMLVATQLKLPQRLRLACVAKAVLRATGIPMQLTPQKSVTRDEPSNSTDQVFGLTYSDDEDSSDLSNYEVDDEKEGDEDDFGTVANQFGRLLSGPLARFYRVSVHPSRIHGRGLFALREFREHEMVIEYTGELIRSVVCDARELKYRATDVDCYMFRIDPDWVIDATYAGNAARFINHSCDPNCYAKVVSIDEKKHIVILAQRRIYPGEELTYDYRFPKESEKLPCNCGSYTCRKYLN